MQIPLSWVLILQSICKYRGPGIATTSLKKRRELKDWSQHLSQNYSNQNWKWHNNGQIDHWDCCRAARPGEISCTLGETSSRRGALDPDPGRTRAGRAAASKEQFKAEGRTQGGGVGPGGEEGSGSWGPAGRSHGWRLSGGAGFIGWGGAFPG